MKKQIKFVIALAVSLLCCINTGVSIFTVSASSNQQINTSPKKVISGGVQGEFTWTLNTVTGQLRVKVSEGVPYPIDDHPSWSMYLSLIHISQMESLVLSGDVYEFPSTEFLQLFLC